ncbi:hypothetical protein FNV43_RR17180 [Rhamnella rubrinervis]|uniref:DEK-C domain-containing protein n=1 Tax=Rhamnella rubrinervis TaxID=2594499 RepID=A0A8K0DX16_9ROSA|nr:hypothetical protein FNV43_RR17180 [Rhamnella rubrinervis]
MLESKSASNSHRQCYRHPVLPSSSFGRFRCLSRDLFVRKEEEARRHRELIERLRDFLRNSELNTTTTAIVRRQLDDDFGVDLSDKKAFIRERVDLFLQSKFEKAEQEQEPEGEEDEGEGDGFYLKKMKEKETIRKRIRRKTMMMSMEKKLKLKKREI